MEDLVRLIHEVGNLKYLPRTGWMRIGIKLPESVADHSFRTAFIAFALAMEKGFDVACKAAVAALLHDVHETRTLDLDRVAGRYVNAERERSEEEQLSILGLTEDFSDVEDYVRDADLLELAFQAVEYSLQNSYAIRFGEGLEFRTEKAKKIYDVLMSRRNPLWWKKDKKRQKE